MTIKLARVVAAAATLGVSLAASADTYEFDTITAYRAGFQGAVTGVPRSSTTPITVAFQYDGTTISGCIPILLTMMEKPGRYKLTLITDATASQRLQSCILTLRE